MIMLKNELVKRSPIRVLEKTIHGGLGKGNLGVFTARKGVGKTACLVHFAIDKLVGGQKVLHISFADKPQHIESWYKQVFHEVAELYDLDDTQSVYDEIIPGRLILHFKQSQLDLDRIKTSIERIMRDGSFLPEMIIVDGFSFEDCSKDQMDFWQALAADNMVEVWFSATLHREGLKLDANGVPAPINDYSDYFQVIIMLQPMQDHVDLKLLKDHDSTDLEQLRLKLDPRTLLIANHRV